MASKATMCRKRQAVHTAW